MPAMDYGALARRMVHISAPFFLVYYFLPSPLWPGGPTREVGLLLIMIAALLFELARLLIGFKVPGMRWYEAEQMSAGAWAAVALTVAFLFFPFSYSAAVIIGMAVVDPLISKVRGTGWYPYVPFLVHLAIVLTVFVLILPLSAQLVLAGVVTSAIAIAAESIKTRYVDDDFLMIVVPLVGLTLIMMI
jgi:hypothetical protein